MVQAELREHYLNKYKELALVVEDSLVSSIANFPTASLSESATYSLLSPGKRLRPVIVLAVGEALGAPRSKLLPFAIAVETIHAASLVHDDLPALDNDTLRRGQPTCHVKFGEGPALLTGDALVGSAFKVLAAAPEISDNIKIELLKLIAQSQIDLNAGQILDLESSLKETGDAAHKKLVERHRLKTGSLFSASFAGPGYIANSGNVVALKEAGYHFGQLFQMIDDLIDELSSAESVGKNTGNDRKLGRSNFVTVHGAKGALAFAEGQLRLFNESLSFLGRDGEFIRAMALGVYERGAELVS